MLSQEEQNRIKREIELEFKREIKDTLIDEHIEQQIVNNHDFSTKRYSGAPSNPLTERMIRYAQKHTDSNRQAAKLLQVDYLTLRKYSRMFIDEETGLDLWELHKQHYQKVKKNFTKLGRKKRTYKSKGRYKHSIEDILSGMRTSYSNRTILRRLIYEGYLPEECQRCGYNERRVTDYCVPLVLAQKDGDVSNFHIDNIEMVCLNCYYHYYGDNMLSIKDFRSYQTYYSSFIRELIVRRGEEKWQDLSDKKVRWGEGLDIEEQSKWNLKFEKMITNIEEKRKERKRKREENDEQQSE